MENLSQGCQNAFAKAGIYPWDISDSAGELKLWDTTGTVENALTESDLLGPSARDPAVYIRSANSVNGQPIATTLQRLYGTGYGNTDYIVLNSGFFAEDSTTQGFTLVHEALHAITGKLDAPLAQALVVNWSKSGDPAAAIAPFFQGGCNTSLAY